jgi:hypothetical protein
MGLTKWKLSIGKMSLASCRLLGSKGEGEMNSSKKVAHQDVLSKEVLIA